MSKQKVSPGDPVESILGRRCLSGHFELSVLKQLALEVHNS